jgi:predicted ATPase
MMMTDPRSAHSAAPIPDTLRASVLERLKLLPRGDRSVLMCASVIGRRFEVGVLIATAVRSRAQIDVALERGCGLQLIEAEDEAGEHYWFRHALTRDVIYGELLASRTRPLHRRIGRALEDPHVLEDGAIEQLAYHWWAAGDARRGLRYNELAGDRAAALYAAADALTHYGRALSLTRIASPEHARLTCKVELLRDGQ